MANFIPSKKEATDFNNGQQYVGANPSLGIEGDKLQAETINNLIESQLWVQDNAIGLPPIGYHYVQYANEPTPAARWSGTSWEIDTSMQGRVLVGSGGSYTLGATGGSADAVVVEHAHRTYVNGVDLNESNDDPIASYATSSDSNLPYSLRAAGTIYNWKGSTNNVGEDGAGKNMPPYVVVNYWKRIA